MYGRWSVEWVLLLALLFVVVFFTMEEVFIAW